MQISLYGYGKMGKLIEKLMLENNTQPFIYQKNADISLLAQNSNIIIDFSTAEATELLITSLLTTSYKNKLIVGTTGLSNRTQELLQQLSQQAIVFVSPNMSLGIFALSELVKIATKILGTSFEIQIIETHHIHKLDSPSGTAIKIAKDIVNTYNATYHSNISITHKNEFIYGDATSNRNIDIVAIREGEVPGRHRFIFKSQYEEIILEHNAIKRELFAEGVLKVTEWIQHITQNGIYHMNDIYKV